MVNVIINSIIAVTLIAAIIKLRKIQTACKELKSALDGINFALAAINELVIDLNNATETQKSELSKVYQEIGNAINTYFTVAGNHMNFDWNMLRNIAAAMCPLVDEARTVATEREDYKKAKDCIVLMSNLEELVKKTQIYNKQ